MTLTFFGVKITTFRPLLRSKVSIGRIDEGGSRGECAGLFSLLDDIVYCISSSFGPVLRLSECIFGTSDSFGNESTLVDFSERQQRSLDIDLVTAGVWIPIATTLMADPAIKMAIFSPGIASILQVSYLNYAILCFIRLQVSWYVGPFF
jgi:hypothetical protein